MNADIKLYSAQVCPFAQRARMLLIEKGLDVDLIEIDLSAKPDWFKEVSPYGKVPVLSYRGANIYESDIITEYLEDVFPSPAFLPSTPEHKAFMRIWTAFMNQQYIPNFYSLLRAQETTEQDERREKLYEQLLFLEREGFGKLANDGPFLFGKQITLADINMYPFFERFVIAEHYRQATLPGECARIREWLGEMEKRDSVQLTRNTREYFIERYKKYAEPDEA